MSLLKYVIYFKMRTNIYIFFFPDSFEWKKYSTSMHQDYNANNGNNDDHIFHILYSLDYFPSTLKCFPHGVRRIACTDLFTE